MNSSRFIMVPQNLSSNSPLIKELVRTEDSIVEELFMVDGAIVMIMNGEINSIKDNPEKLAFQLLKRDVFKIIGKVNFAINHTVIATEYLFSFVDTFSAYGPDYNQLINKQQWKHKNRRLNSSAASSC